MRGALALTRPPSESSGLSTLNVGGGEDWLVFPVCRKAEIYFLDTSKSEPAI
jgi:hypothetical protein